MSDDVLSNDGTGAIDEDAEDEEESGASSKAKTNH
jgi:hypothetical protein